MTFVRTQDCRWCYHQVQIPNHLLTGGLRLPSQSVYPGGAVSSVDGESSAPAVPLCSDEVACCAPASPGFPDLPSSSSSSASPSHENIPGGLLSKPWAFRYTRRLSTSSSFFFLRAKAMSLLCLSVTHSTRDHCVMKAMGCDSAVLTGGVRWAKGEVRRNSLMETVAARVVRMLCADPVLFLVVARQKDGGVHVAVFADRWASYQADTHVDVLIGQKPEHETALGRHHMGISLIFPLLNLLR